MPSRTACLVTLVFLGLGSTRSTAQTFNVDLYGLLPEPIVQPLEVPHWRTQSLCFVGVIFQRSDQGFQPLVDAGATERMALYARPGSYGRATFYVAFSSTLPSTGIRAWQFGVQVSDNLVVEAVSRAGLVADAAPGTPGLFRPDEDFGTQRALDPDLVNPATGRRQGEGFFQAVAFLDQQELPPVGTSTVLRVTVRTKEVLRRGAPQQARVHLREPFSSSAGAPWNKNSVTVDSRSVDICSSSVLELEFTPIVVTPPEPLFLRGDLGGAPGVDMADAVNLLEHLFLKPEPFDCERSADANGDRTIDVSDATHLLRFLFTGGKAPPPPFGKCGPDPDPENPLRCRLAAPCAQR